MKTVKILRISWVSILLITLGFLLWKFIAPFGLIYYSSDFSKYNYFISELTPKDRLVTVDKQTRNLVQAEPIYFYLKTLRPFTSAEITIHYSHPSSLMELGICRDKDRWNFERQPIYFDTLEKFASSDQTFFENGLLLWQKNKKYNSISDFLTNPPSVEKIGVYNYNLPNVFELKNYVPLALPQKYMLGAQGGYSLVTYSNGDPIDFKFVVRKKGDYMPNSIITITAYNSEGQIIETKNIDWLLSSKTSDIQYKEFNFKLEDISRGAFRIEFKAGNEIDTESIETNQSVLSVLNKLQLSDFSRTNFSIFTDATTIAFQTINPKNTQLVKIHEQVIDINETYKQFSFHLQDQTRNVKEIKLEKDDLLLAGDGVFALKPTEIINPSPRQFTNTIDLESSGLEYVVANYQPVGRSNTGKRTISFDLSQACLDKDRYPFLISMPGIDEKTPVEISDIHITLHGKNIFQILKSLWNRL